MAKNEKDIWFETEYQPFDLGSREKFYLSATHFLYTNFEERLANGYYFEFGCYKGRTMRFCWRHTRHNFNFTYVAFDSFEGLPEPDPVDAHPGWKAGDFSMGEQAFVDIVVGAGMPRPRLQTVKGFYDRSLTPELQRQLLPRRASIVYIDCDLYESTVPVLKFLPPFLQLGTVVAFDDWTCYFNSPARGQRRAWREFREANPELNFEPFVSSHHLMSFIFTGFGPEMTAERS
jgi:O-methyltransferase